MRTERSFLIWSDSTFGLFQLMAGVRLLSGGARTRRPYGPTGIPRGRGFGPLLKFEMSVLYGI